MFIGSIKDMKKIISALLSVMIFVMYSGASFAAQKASKIASPKAKKAPQAVTIQQNEATI